MPLSNFAMENAGLITYATVCCSPKPEKDTLSRKRLRAESSRMRWRINGSAIS